jgi:two-component system phosphate regulon sensor histidine kinase PhoR
MTFLIILLFTLLVTLFIYYLRIKRRFDEISKHLDSIIENREIKTPLQSKRYLHSSYLKAKKIEDTVKALKKTLEEKEKLLEKLFYSVPIPLAFFSKDGKAEFKNYSFEKLFGKVDNLEDLKNLLRKEAFYKITKETEEKGSIKNIEIDWKNRVFSVNLDRIKFEGKDSYLISFLDITELKNTQRIKTEFTSNVSHELKTPLTVIKGFIETLEKELPSDKLYMIKTIKKHIDRLQNLVSDILLLDMAESGKNAVFEAFDLNETIETAINLLYKEAKEKNIEVTFEKEENIILNGDSFLMLQAIINILSNAIKYNMPGGKVIIKTSKSDNKIILSCKDTGVGIPSQYISRIFERFFVVDKSRSRQLGGTGLGLSIVKHIVELHKGIIEVKSELGKGTEFIIELPCLLTKV